jgi:hypothetical protein
VPEKAAVIRAMEQSGIKQQKTDHVSKPVEH